MPKLSKEEILKSEDLLLDAILLAASFKDNADNHLLIEIKRACPVGGEKKTFLKFHICPLSDEELYSCHRDAAVFEAHPVLRKARVEVDINIPLYKSNKIYAATIPADRENIWDNKALKDKLGVKRGVDVIDCILLSGEKSGICNKIDEISGYAQDTVEVAKN